MYSVNDVLDCHWHALWFSVSLARPQWTFPQAVYKMAQRFSPSLVLSTASVIHRTPYRYYQFSPSLPSSKYHQPTTLPPVFSSVYQSSQSRSSSKYHQPTTLPPVFSSVYQSSPSRPSSKYHQPTTLRSSCLLLLYLNQCCLVKWRRILRFLCALPGLSWRSNRTYPFFLEFWLRTRWPRPQDLFGEATCPWLNICLPILLKS